MTHVTDMLLWGRSKALPIHSKDICKEEAYEWLKSRDKLVRSLSIVARVRDDMHGFEDDMNRGYVTNSISCYKKQHGVSEEEAFIKLRQMVANVYKIVNEEFLKKIDVPNQVLKAVINCARMINVSYEIDDEFTRPGVKLTSHITAIYVDL